MSANSFETGLSDHHHMTYTILKSKQNFKQYDSDHFKLDILNSMSALETHAAFKNNFVSILDKHAPKKTNMSESLSDIVKFKRQQNLLGKLNE